LIGWSIALAFLICQILDYVKEPMATSVSVENTHDGIQLPPIAICNWYGNAFTNVIFAPIKSIGNNSYRVAYNNNQTSATLPSSSDNSTTSFISSSATAEYYRCAITSFPKTANSSSNVRNGSTDSMLYDAVEQSMDVKECQHVYRVTQSITDSPDYHNWVDCFVVIDQPVVEDSASTLSIQLATWSQQPDDIQSRNSTFIKTAFTPYLGVATA
jgi:hypothetical protein